MTWTIVTRDSIRTQDSLRTAVAAPFDDAGGGPASSSGDSSSPDPGRSMPPPGLPVSTDEHARRQAWRATQEYVEKHSHGIAVADLSVAVALSGNAGHRSHTLMVLTHAQIDMLSRRENTKIARRLLSVFPLLAAPRTRFADVERLLPATRERLVDLMPQDCALPVSWTRLAGASPASAEAFAAFCLADHRVVELVQRGDTDDHDRAAGRCDSSDDRGSSRIWGNGDGDTWGMAHGRSDDGALAQLAVFLPGNLTEDRSKHLTWSCRRLSEQWHIAWIMSDVPGVCAYAGGHVGVARSLVPLLRADELEKLEATRRKLYVDLCEKSRQVATRTETDRHDVELRHPQLGGRVRRVHTVAVDGAGTWPPCAVDEQLRLVTDHGTLPGVTTEKRTRVLVAGHDLKFAPALIDEMARRSDIDLSIRRWPDQYGPAPGTEDLPADEPDVVWVEFASGPAAWYSRHKAEGQRLVVRVHGYELHGPWGGDIDFSQVDVVVFVSEKQRAAGELQWNLAQGQSMVVPNAVEVHEFDRPKHDHAPFTLGLLGWTPALKRVDRAVSLLRELRRHDDRFTLLVRGTPPDTGAWYWREPHQQAMYTGTFDELRRDADLARAVWFQEHSSDVGRWFQNVGWILSPSDRESFHLAPVEGMTSGAVPVVWDREGATEIFPEEYIVEDVAEAVRRILDTFAAGTFVDASRTSKKASAQYATRRIRCAWNHVLGLEI